MATVEDLPTAKVTGQYLFVSQDNADEGTRPNAVLVTGYVRFTCSATPPILYKNKRVSAVPLVHDAAFDSEGFLIPLDAAQNTPIVVNGKLERGIELLADSPEASPRGFTWNVSFNLREVITGRTIQIPAFDILVKEGENYDLVDYMPVGRSNGVGIIKGDSVYDLAVANGFKGSEAEWLESIKGEAGNSYVIPQMQIAPVDDIPTITNSRIDIWAGAPTIEGSAGWYREKRVDAGERVPGAAQGDGKALDLNGSSYFSYPALPAASDWANNSGRVVMSDYKPGGEAQYANWLFNLEFVTSSPEVEFFMNAGTTNGRFGTVLVNGKRISERAIRHTAVAGEGVGVKLTFPSAKERTIRVYGLNNGTGRFGGVAVAAGYTVVKPKVRPARKIAFIGDSFVNGTSEVSNTETFIWRLADLLGADEVLQAGIGGTSFNSGDVATRFANRIDMVLAYNPDVIVFAGGRNDSATGLKEAVTNTLARAGNKELYVVSTASDATQAAVNDALAAGAAAAGIPFVRADVDALPREDAVHLTYAGHQAFADQLFARLISMKANSIPTEQAVAGYLTTPSSPVYKAAEDTTRRAAQPIVGELVTNALANNATIVKAAQDAATPAVTRALDDAGVVRGAGVADSGNISSAWRHTTENGDFLPLGYDENLHLDDHARRIFKEDLNNTTIVDPHPEYSRVITTEDGYILAGLRWDGTWNVPGLGMLASPTAAARTFYNDVPYVIDSDVMPPHANKLKIAGWGSSSMGGIYTEFNNMAKGFGATYYNGGQGGEKSYHIAARLGSVPARISFSNSKDQVPASGAIAVTSSNIDSASLKTYAGYVLSTQGERIYGSLSNTNTVLTFTRKTEGAVVDITPDSQFIPTDGVAQRDAVTLLWMGKNNTGQTQRVIDETNASFEYLAPLVKRCIVMGHFVNGGTAAGNVTRTHIKTINDAHRARFGEAFIDVSAYLTSAQIWIDSGVTPTDADLAEQALGNKPPSLSSDTGHMNATGYKTVMEKLVRPRIQSLGWY